MIHQVLQSEPEPSSHVHPSGKTGSSDAAIMQQNAGDTSCPPEQTMAAQRLERIAIPGLDGIPALHIALSTGNADAVRTFGELLHAVPEEQLTELLAAHRPDGVPGLQMALQRGHADAIRAFAGLLARLPGEERTDIIAGKVRDRPTGLRLALRNLHADAIREFDMLLERYCVPMQRCAAQIMDAANDLHYVLRRIAQDSNSTALAATAAYVALAIRAAPALHPAQRASLLEKVYCFLREVLWTVPVHSITEEAAMITNQ